MSKEAMKLALEALEEIESYYGYDRSVGAMASSMYEASNLAKITSTRIREALAEQPAQQEPVAMHEDWYDSNSCGHCGMVGGHTKTCRHYTSPPAQRKPLTDEQIEDIWADCPADWDDKINVLTLARAIEAAHGIKENT